MDFNVTGYVKKLSTHVIRLAVIPGSYNVLSPGSYIDIEREGIIPAFFLGHYAFAYISDPRLVQDGQIFGKSTIFILLFALIIKKSSLS